MAAFIAWKSAGLALLALWAAQRARGRDGWLIVAVLALGALGDAVLEIDRVGGAIVFLVGHIVAIALYRRNARGSGGATGVALALAIPAVAYGLTRDAGVALYALGLGAMTGAAWASDFRRDRVALGALLFASSDLLIFAEDRVLAGSIFPGLLIWPLYFGGQALIAWGVVTTLAARDATMDATGNRNEDLHHRL